MTDPAPREAGAAARRRQPARARSRATHTTHALLGADHPLARAQARMTARAGQAALLGAVLGAALAALAAGAHQALVVAIAAFTADAWFAVSLAMLQSDRRALTRELIIAGPRQPAPAGHAARTQPPARARAPRRAGHLAAQARPRRPPPHPARPRLRPAIHSAHRRRRRRRAARRRRPARARPRRPGWRRPDRTPPERPRLALYGPHAARLRHDLHRIAFALELHDEPPTPPHEGATMPPMDTNTPRTQSAIALDNSFIGNTVQVCVVSHDLQRTMEGMTRLGIGPWQVFTFSPDNVDDMTYRGRPAEMTFRLAIAYSGSMMWELIQPLTGPSIYADFLDQHGEGLHHVLVDCNGAPWDERLRLFEAHGYQTIQSGVWLGRVPFAYFATEDDTATTIETASFPHDFDLPEPEQWYPGPPPA
jgi:methylmalonyl-CoA/ethylmalonyl-CoA epimerase